MTKEVYFDKVIDFLEGPGVRNWQFQPTGIKLVNIRNLVEDSLILDNTVNHLSFEEVEQKYSHFLLQEGDFVMASSGVTWGKIAEVKEEHLPLCLNTSIIKLKTKNGLVEKKYLWFFIKSHKFKSQIDKLITGSAQPNFGPSHLKKVTIPLPPLATQQRIATVLDEADALRKKTQQLIDSYDKLAQSIFLDMFGDPVRNEKGWEKKKLGSITDISSGSTPSRENESYYIGNIPWIKTTELRGIVINDSLEKISIEALKDTSCKLYPKGTILIAMYGQGVTRGKVGMLGLEAATNQACAALPPSDKMNFNYLFNHLKYSYEELRNLGRGGNQPNLNSGLVKSFKVLNPPISLQTQFAEKIALIDQQKELAKQSLKESEDLFNTLLKKAFKGELELK